MWSWSLLRKWTGWTRSCPPAWMRAQVRSWWTCVPLSRSLSSTHPSFQSKSRTVAKIPKKGTKASRNDAETWILKRFGSIWSLFLRNSRRKLAPLDSIGGFLMSRFQSRQVSDFTLVCKMHPCVLKKIQTQELSPEFWLILETIVLRN